MTLRLPKYELVDVDVKASVIEARRLFLELVGKFKPEVSSDLMRLYNSEFIPDFQDASNLAVKLFLLHTKFHHFYELELENFGFGKTVRNTPLLAFYDFVFRNQTKLLELIEKNKPRWQGYSPNLIISSAIDEIIPDWETLERMENSGWLCSELKAWSEKWNLTDSWCLDFALECLKDFKQEFTDKLIYPTDCQDYITNNTYGFNEIYDLQSYWKHGRAWLSCLNKLRWQKISTELFLIKVKNYPLFEYSWKMRTNGDLVVCFSLQGFYNPLAMKPEEFRKEVEKEFWDKFFGYFSNHRESFDKNLLINELSKFESKVNTYIERADELVKPHSTETLIKRSGDKHFQWLEEYQIDGKSFNQISIETGLDRRAVTDGIRGVADIIGLTLRSNSRGGRRKGTTDKAQERNLIVRNIKPVR